MGRQAKRGERTFTLLELQAAIASAISDGDSDLQKLRPPSMPTMKNWSRSGFFDKARTAPAAIQLVLTHLRANPRYYPEASVTTLKAEPSQSNSPPHTRIEQVAANIQNETLRSIEARLNDIEKSIASFSQASGKPAGPTDDPHKLLNRVLSAVEFADSTRKQGMVRLDEEIQKARSGHSGALPLTSSKQAEASASMDIQRVIGRVSQVEQKLVGVQDLLLQILERLPARAP